jgi:Delta7-sterol 5-desaturase
MNTFSQSFFEHYGPFYVWQISSLLIIFRYLVFAGLAYWIFYVWGRSKFLHIKIQEKFPVSASILYEIINSIFSAFLFGLFTLLIFYLKSLGFTLIYSSLDEYGYLYLFISWVLLVISHDAYFYWVHRLMHTDKLFAYVHRVHHRSHNPTPWASFSFHPIEAIIEFAFLPLAVFCIPLHPLVIAAWSFWMIGWNVVGHLGFELLSKNTAKHPILKFFNTSTYHNLHHQRNRGNFGLYFNVWDRWMNTTDTTYDQAFINQQNKNREGA